MKSYVFVEIRQEGAGQCAGPNRTRQDGCHRRWRLPQTPLLRCLTEKRHVCPHDLLP